MSTKTVLKNMFREANSASEALPAITCEYECVGNSLKIAPKISTFRVLMEKLEYDPALSQKLARYWKKPLATMDQQTIEKWLVRIGADVHRTVFTEGDETCNFDQHVIYTHFSWESDDYVVLEMDTELYASPRVFRCDDTELSDFSRFTFNCFECDKHTDTFDGGISFDDDELELGEDCVESETPEEGMVTVTPDGKKLFCACGHEIKISMYYF